MRGEPEVFNRPLQKLYPLECAKEVGKKREKELKTEGRENSEELMNGVKGKIQSVEKPRSAAAQNARAKFQLMLDP